MDQKLSLEFYHGLLVRLHRFCFEQHKVPPKALSEEIDKALFTVGWALLQLERPDPKRAAKPNKYDDYYEDAREFAMQGRIPNSRNWRHAFN